MILVDANLLIYAYIKESPKHSASKEWFDSMLNGSARVGLPWPALLAFVRLITNPRIFSRAVSVEQAWNQVKAWLEQRPVWVPEATDRHSAVLDALFAAVSMRSDLVSDAHLAALAIEHGLTLCSTDDDFARFPGLSWKNPIA